MNSGQIAEHRRTGSLAAQRALRAANTDYEAPIDVFGAIERAQIWLLFQRLDRLYGAYQRRATPGIVIHAGHPRPVQRFTAAHELGHHHLGHDVSVDRQDDVERARTGLPAQEIQAQAFAATYLMPVQLVNRALSHRHLGHRPDSLTPEQAYLISLDLGSSYAATITQLKALDRITAAHLRRLSEERPIDIKTRLAQGHRPQNSRADVWPLSEADDGRTLHINRDDELHFSLVELPSTGYRWRPQSSVAAFEMVGDEPIAPEQSDPLVYGGERTRHVWWRALSPTEASVAAELRRDFGSDQVVSRRQLPVA